MLNSKFKKALFRIIIAILILMISVAIVGAVLVARGIIPNPFKSEVLFGKPVIYLYPTHTEQVSVTLTYAGTVNTVYPAYNQKNGWNINAEPNGDLTDITTGQTYSYLFWEGTSTDKILTPTEGFVVKGSDTVNFLREKLSYLGLTPKEYNDMIVYWLPKMQQNNYNLIYFAGTDYTEKAKLAIEPKPDSLLRVFMMFKPLSTPINVPEQKLNRFERKGFTVVEWGGAQI